MAGGTTHPADTGKSFLAHLEDLRRALIGAAISLLIGLAIACPLAPSIVTLLKRPMVGSRIDPDTFLKVIRLGDGFDVAMQVIFWGGLLLGLPGIVVSIGRFVFPGLTARERRVITRALIATTLLFALGVVIGYFTTIRLAVTCMLQVNDWLGVPYDFIELSDYCGFVLRLLIAFGLVFEMPVVVVVLGYLGLISSGAMRARRRHVIVALCGVAMVLTPPDPVSMVLMSAPLVLLYEACIWIVWSRERGRTATPPEA